MKPKILIGLAFLLILITSVSALNIDVSFPSNNTKYGIKEYNSMENITWTTDETSTCTWSMGSITNANMGTGTSFHDKKKMITISNSALNGGRSDTYMFSMNGKIYIYGGYNATDYYLADIFVSEDDGNTFNNLGEANLGKIDTFSHGINNFCVFNNYLYALIPSFNSGENNEVWRTSDGVNWEMIATNITQRTDDLREDTSCVVFNNELYLIGGYTYTTGICHSGESYDGYCSDVWKTADGENWELVVADTDLQDGFWLYNKYISFKDKVYLIGGWDKDANINLKIYETTNMINFTEIFDLSTLGISGFDAKNFNSHLEYANTGKELYILATKDGLRKIFSSRDMVNWKELTDYVGYDGSIAEVSMTAHKGKVYLYGGYDANCENAYCNNIDYYVNMSEIQSEGENEITITCNDTDMDFTEKKIKFRKDGTAPSISIISPTNTTYKLNKASDKNTMSFTTNEPASCTFSLNYGSSISVGSGTAFSELISGTASNFLTITCLDDVDNLNTSAVSFANTYNLLYTDAHDLVKIIGDILGTSGIETKKIVGLLVLSGMITIGGIFIKLLII